MATENATDWIHFNPDQASVKPDANEMVEGFCVITGAWGSPCRAKMVPWEGPNHVTVYRVMEPPLSIPPTIAELRLHDAYMKKYDPDNYCEPFPALTPDEINKCFDHGIKQQWIGKYFSQQWVQEYILKKPKSK